MEKGKLGRPSQNSGIPWVSLTERLTMRMPISRLGIFAYWYLHRAFLRETELLTETIASLSLILPIGTCRKDSKLSQLLERTANRPLPVLPTNYSDRNSERTKYFSQGILKYHFQKRFRQYGNENSKKGTLSSRFLVSCPTDSGNVWNY